MKTKILMVLAALALAGCNDKQLADLPEGVRFTCASTIQTGNGEPGTGPEFTLGLRDGLAGAMVNGDLFLMRKDSHDAGKYRAKSSTYGEAAVEWYANDTGVMTLGTQSIRFTNCKRG